MGWEPETVYVHDEQGRVVSSRQQVEWDETERDWMLALAEYRSSVLCECGCGFPKTVSQDPGTEFRVTVPAPTRCHVRTALVRAQKESEHLAPQGLLWSARVED